MPFSFFTPTTSQESNSHTKMLTDLANFIQTKANATTLYNAGDKGGNIDFSELSVGHFKTSNPSNLNLLNDTRRAYELKLKQLQTMDFKLGISFTLGLAAIALSPLTFGISALVSAAAFSYFGYQLKTREIIQNDYKKAQADMTIVYIWAMNDTQSTLTVNGDTLPEKTRDISDEAYAEIIQKNLHSDIKAMHATFNPMLSDNDIWAYTRSNLDSAITMGRNASNESAIDNESTTKLQLSLNYLLYGQDQGSTLQIAKGLVSLCSQTIMNLAISLKDTVISATGMSEADIADKASDVYQSATNSFQR